MGNCCGRAQSITPAKATVSSCSPCTTKAWLCASAGNAGAGNLGTAVPTKMVLCTRPLGHKACSACAATKAPYEKPAKASGPAGAHCSISISRSWVSPCPSSYTPSLASTPRKLKRKQFQPDCTKASSQLRRQSSGLVATLGHLD